MTKNKYDEAKIKKNKKGYRNLIIAGLILFIPAVLGLIGFNILLLYSTTNIFLAFLVETFEQYVWIINLGLIFVVGFSGLFLALGVSGLKSYKKKVKNYYLGKAPELKTLAPPKKDAILEFLTENKGKAFTADSLVSRMNHEGLSEDIESVLSDLVNDNKINRTVKENTMYYSI